ncbi:zinc finger protein 616 isoform X1 [Biomphalaria glabrata]|nr:zinc finger protein 616 isoform X1 [Biomphalaria glabrata]
MKKTSKSSSRFQAESDSKSLQLDTISTVSRGESFILCSSCNKQDLTCVQHGKCVKYTRLLSSNSTTSQIYENPFQLIKSISDGPVSLESIPTISLFKPNLGESSPVDNAPQEVVDEPSSSDHCLTLNTPAVLGTDKMPPSLLVYIKQHQNNIANKNKLYLSSVSHVESTEPSKTMSHIDDNDDTDTEINDSSSEPSCDKTVSGKSLYSLPTSDTVILDEDKYVPATKNHLQCDDTLILNQETEVHHNLNTTSSMPTVLDNVTTISDRNVSGDIIPILPLESSSQLSAPLEPIKKTLYFLSSDGQLTAISLTPQLLTAINEAAVIKQSEAKATQTDLVFGTGNLFFKSLVTSSDNQNSCSRDQLCDVSSVGETTLVTFSNDNQSLYDNSVDNVDKINNISSQRLIELHSQIPDAENQTDPIGSFHPSNNLVIHKAPLVKTDCHKEINSKPDFKNQAKSLTKVYQCDLCIAKFTRLGNFTRHRKIHNLHSESQPLFKCETCGREFLQRCDLKRHMLIHTKQEPHRCDQCGKGYIRRSDLVVHLRFHNKDKAFKCSLCEKQFFQTGDLSRHIRRAHKPSSQLTCGHCDRKYARETTLIRHMKTMHKDIIVHTV